MFGILLTLIGKGIITGAASKGGQALIEKLKEYFEATDAEKIGNAYLEASYKSAINENIDIDNILLDDEYYKSILVGINNSNLSCPDKRIGKYFLLELIKDPKLAALILSQKMDDLNNDTSDIKNYLLPKSLEQLHITQSNFIRKISIIKNYIPRSIYQKGNEDLQIKTFDDLLKNADKKPLRSLILANGGEGKTEFLKYLAHNSINNSLYPVYISLKDYEASSQPLQSYIEILQPDIKKIAKDDFKFLCFFLDGFDEIGEIEKAIKQIHLFCNTYPETHIVLSSRNNSYSNELSDFEVYLFSEIDILNIENYIKDKYTITNIDFITFYNEVYKGGFLDILHNPLYLSILIEVYIENKHSLEGISRIELFDKFFSQRSSWDKDHRPDLRLDNPFTKRQIKVFCKKIAFCMALMGKRSISGNELIEIIENKISPQLIEHALPIQKSNELEGEQYWMFEHNIYLEHFAASVLTNLSLYQILEYTTSLNKVKTEWRDIIVHLLGLLNKEDQLFQELSDWLLNNDIDVFTYIEKEKIEQSTRERIFKEIYLKHKEKSIWIDSYKRSIDILASFGESGENIKFIFEELANPQNDARARINAALLFKNFTLKSIKEQYIDQYLEVIKTTSEEDSFVLSYLLSALPSNEEKYVDSIVLLFGNTENVEIRVALFKIIKDSSLVDKYIEFFLYASTKSDILPNGAHLSHYYDTIDDALLNADSYDSFVKIVSFLLKAGRIDYYFQHKLDFIEKILERSINYHNDDLFTVISDLFLLYNYEHSYGGVDYDKIKSFLQYFDETNTRKQLFYKLISKLEKDQDNNYTAIAALLNEKLLDDLFKLNLSKEQLIGIYLHLNKGSNYYNSIKDFLENKHGYIEPVYENKLEKRRKEEFDILFDKERFYQECLNVFSIYNTDPITTEQLYNRDSDTDEKYINHSVRGFLKQKISKDDLIKKSNVIHTFEVDISDVNRYLNKSIFDFLRNLKSKEGILRKISKDQRQHIIDWYNELLPKFDFEKALDFTTKNSIDVRSIMLVFYMLNLDLDCPDDILVKMLYLPTIHPYKHDFHSIAEKIKDRGFLQIGISENLKKYYMVMFNGDVYTQVKYIIGNKLSEVYPILIEMLQNESWDELELKKIIIRGWIVNDLDNSVLVNILPSLNHQLQLEIYSRFAIEKDIILPSTPIHTFLNDLKDEDIYLEAILALLAMRDIIGLQLLIDWLNNKKDIDGVIDLKYKTILKIKLHYQDLSVLDYLNQLLELSFCVNNDIIRSNDLKNLVTNNFIEIGLQSEEKLNLIVENLENFIEKHKGQLENVLLLNYNIQDLKEKFWNNSYTPYSSKEAICICNQMVVN